MTPSALRQTFALANAFKEGDLSVGGTTDDRLRDDARCALLATTIGDIRRTALVDDAVTDALHRSRDPRADADLDALTIARVRSILLGPEGVGWVESYGAALGSEVVAAVAKVMSNDELSAVARALFNPLPGRGVTIGSASHFGSRIQPNSPGDDEGEILFSVLEGLSYGCGDVIIGLNPAADELDTIVRLERLLEQIVQRLGLPTRYCVLSDMVKQQRAQAHTRVDVGFQSLAGTSKALVGMVGIDVHELADLARSFDGLYFETGQGSEVTNGTAEGVDMVTLEARAYGVARHIRREASAARGSDPLWMIVNDVAGFIGPEVFRTGDQLERACLEDSVMAKLHGLTMGLDVCATFHMGISPQELRGSTMRIAERAAPAYLMAVAGNADPMLGYLTTSFREHPRLRSNVGRRLATPMSPRLQALGVVDAEDRPTGDVDAIPRLYATYAKAGGDREDADALARAGRRRLSQLRERGFDLGGVDDRASDSRLDRIYGHARRALYAALDEAVLRDTCAHTIRVRTAATDRDDYLAHPAAGERLREQPSAEIARAFASRTPRVLLIVSDGLNANAANEHLRALVPPLRRLLADHLDDLTVVVQNGRVRSGYAIGGLAHAEVVIHLIGERPGTGLNTLSAYVTYGRDRSGRWRWGSTLEHSVTNAICGIHPLGKPPHVAAAEIARTVTRIFDQRVSGVALTVRPT